jgi:hypothetical protein
MIRGFCFAHLIFEWIDLLSQPTDNRHQMDIYQEIVKLCTQKQNADEETSELEEKN